ncbi:hypothetical protein [Jiulongibacter sp. NS-SX5]|uniref:hypothetical protein n=1 Tax=Jiulongibacter sp. NS-SX5 TaxID=3463854 RepID=UPI00405975DB
MKYILPLLLVCFSAKAQKTFREKPSWQAGGMAISYYGDQVTNPGLSVAYEYGIYSKVKTKTRIKRGQNRVKYKTNRIELVPKLSVYTDPQAHVGILPNLSLQLKRINHHRRVISGGIGLGLFSHFLDNVYEVNDTEVGESKQTLTSYLAPSFHIAIGRVKNKNGRQQGLLFGLNTSLLTGFNNSVQLAPALELGYRF